MEEDKLTDFEKEEYYRKDRNIFVPVLSILMFIVGFLLARIII